MTTPLRRIRGIFRAIRATWSIAGLTLLAILLMEGGLRAVFAVKDHLGAAATPDPRVIAEGYGGEAWPVRHYRELERLAERWEPYVYFRQRPFSGETISIDERGFRRTWQAPHDASLAARGRPFRVLMLGGSSLWGFGARDDHTIPSLVARKLHERGRRIVVGNLAEIGYVSTQEVIAMVRELQSGDRPDLVIFYDGVNDSTSALLEGEAGVTTNERNRRAEFNIRQSPSRLAAAMIARLVEDTATSRLARTIGRRIVGYRDPAGALPGLDHRRELIAGVVRRYIANVEIADRFGREFGFTALHYWQPVVFDKKSLAPFEREEAQKLGWARSFLVEVYDAIRGSTELRVDPRFHDLSRLFDETRGLVFIDYCHTTEAANEVIAEAIARDAIAALDAIDRGRRGDRETGAVR